MFLYSRDPKENSKRARASCFRATRDIDRKVASYADTPLPAETRRIIGWSIIGIIECRDGKNISTNDACL